MLKKLSSKILKISIKISLILFTTLFTTLFTSQVINANENYSDLVLEDEGLCQNYNLKFTIFNTTQFDNKEEIEDDLCKDDEDPKNDSCSEFDKFNAKIIIYDGPSDGRSELLNIDIKDTNTFNYKFTYPNDFYTEIIPEGHYNEFNTKIEVQECRFAENNKHLYPEITEPDSEPELTNKTFTYNNNEYILNLENTNITTEAQIQIQTIDLQTSQHPQIENTIKTFEITTENTQFSKIEIELQEPTLNRNLEIKILKINEMTNSWEVFIDNPQIRQQTIIFETTSTGIFAIQTQEPIIIEPEEPTSTITNENTDTNSQDNTNTEDSTIEIDATTDDESFFSTTVIIIIIVILTALAGVGTFLIRQKKKENYHNHREVSSNPINSEIYNKTKQYVQKYRTKYNKEQIKESLTKAEIDIHIIEKVLEEEFPKN